MPASISTNNNQGRLDYLDGIRGVGALVVFYYHLLVMFIGIPFPQYTALYHSVLLDGPLAVKVFFVISGMALSAASLKNPDAPILPSLAARYFRLALPIFFTSLIAFALMGFGLMYNEEAARTGISVDWLGSFYPMFPSIEGVLRFSFYEALMDYNLKTSYNSSLWTIPFEFAGSLAIYLMLLVINDPKRRRLAAIVLFVALYKNNTFIACFFAGYLIADLNIYLAGRKWKGVNFAGIVLIVGASVLVSIFRPKTELYWAAIAILLVLGCTLSVTAKALLSSKIGKVLGKLSFPLYLSHIFVICSLTSFLYLELQKMGFGTKAAFLVNLTLSSICAFALAAALVPMETLVVSLSKKIGKAIAAAGTKAWKTLRLPDPV
ncbi:acyltransferase [Rhizobium sp. MHM7A]|uniref:acyltransferase family protein n=1 Tax=Rhizobium sp. MHM7A TaxID=2583233 RepID=UPI001105E600|nr:acyltransferase [Rhizobium sp. MHM7A]TLX16804.1 acyltransferase [Rhizobium sp. MHM7A]